MKRWIFISGMLALAGLGWVGGHAICAEAGNPATALAANYGSMGQAERRAALNALAIDAVTGRELMKAVEGKKLPTGDFDAQTIQRLKSLPEQEVAAWAARLWAVARPSPAAKLKEMEKYRALVTGDALAKADASAGRVIYAKTCQQCHLLFGMGGKVGPDITGSSREDVDLLLWNIIDPSAVITRQYQVTNLWTKDDQILSGIISREDEGSLTLVTESTSTTLQKSEIDQRKTSEMSIMPEGQLLPMKAQEVIDLITYVRSGAQVALPAGEKK